MSIKPIEQTGNKAGLFLAKLCCPAAHGSRSHPALRAEWECGGKL